MSTLNDILISRHQVRQVLLQMERENGELGSMFENKEEQIEQTNDITMADRILQNLEKCTSKKINVDDLTQAMEKVAKHECRQTSSGEINFLALQISKNKENIPRKNLRGALERENEKIKNKLMLENYNPLISIIMGQLENFRTTMIDVSEFFKTFEKIAGIVQVDEAESGPLLRQIIDVFKQREFVSRYEVRRAMQEYNSEITKLFNPNSDMQVTNVDKVLLNLEYVNQGDIDKALLIKSLNEIFDIDKSKVEEFASDVFADEDKMPRNELRVQLAQFQDKFDSLTSPNSEINKIMKNFDQINEGKISRQNIVDQMKSARRSQSDYTELLDKILTTLPENQALLEKQKHQKQQQNNLAQQMISELKDVIYFDFVEKRDALRRKQTIKRQITERQSKKIEDAVKELEEDSDLSVDLSDEEERYGDQRQIPSEMYEDSEGDQPEGADKTDTQPDKTRGAKQILRELKDILKFDVEDAAQDIKDQQENVNPNQSDLKKKSDESKQMILDLQNDVKQLFNNRMCKDIVQSIIRQTFKKARENAREKKQKIKDEKRAISADILSNIVDKAVSQGQNNQELKRNRNLAKKALNRHEESSFEQINESIIERSEPESSFQDEASQRDSEPHFSARGQMSAKRRASQYRRNKGFCSSDFVLVPDNHLKILLNNLKSHFQRIEAQDLDKTIIMERTKSEFQKAERQKQREKLRLEKEQEQRKISAKVPAAEEKDQGGDMVQIIRTGLRKKIFGRGSSPRGSRRGSSLGNFEIGGDKQKIQEIDDKIAELDKQDKEAERNKVDPELKKTIVENGKLIADRLKHERAERNRIAAEKEEQERREREQKLREMEKANSALKAKEERRLSDMERQLKDAIANAANKTKHDPTECEFCIEIAKLKQHLNNEEQSLKQQKQNIEDKNGQYKIALEGREERRISREQEKIKIKARIEELCQIEADIDEDLLSLEDVKTRLHEILHRKLYDYSEDPELEEEIKVAEQEKIQQEQEEKDLLQKKDDTLEEMMDLEDREMAIDEEEEKDIEDMQKLEVVHKREMQKMEDEVKETEKKISEIKQKIEELEGLCKQRQEELAALNKHDPETCQYCIEVSQLEIKKKTQLSLLQKTNDKISDKKTKHAKELKNREERKENRDTEIKELKERIEELAALEAEIDEDLLELEDVKTIIHEKLHMKLYDYTNNPQLKKEIEEAEQQKLEQEQEEKDLLQQKDDTLEEMMDLEDREQVLIEEEQEDIMNMEKVKAKYNENIDALNKQAKKLEDGIDQIDERIKELKELCLLSQEDKDELLRKQKEEEERLAAEKARQEREAARKLKEEQDRLRRLEEERKRLAEEAEKKRLAEEAERKRLEEEARLAKLKEEERLKNLHDPETCENCIAIAALKVQLADLRQKLQTVEDDIKKAETDHNESLEQRKQRKLNREMEKMEIRNRIDDLLALEKDIDQDLLCLEDVKTSLNEILHKKLYDYSDHPELEDKIREAEKQKVQQEKEEKDLLQNKDETLEEMMNLEDKEQLLIEEEEADIENMKKLKVQFDNDMEKLVPKKSQYQSEIKDVLQQLEDRKGKCDLLHPIIKEMVDQYKEAAEQVDKAKPENPETDERASVRDALHMEQLKKLSQILTEKDTELQKMKKDDENAKKRDFSTKQVMWLLYNTYSEEAVLKLQQQLVNEIPLPPGSYTQRAHNQLALKFSELQNSIVAQSKPELQQNLNLPEVHNTKQFQTQLMANLTVPVEMKLDESVAVQLKNLDVRSPRTITTASGKNDEFNNQNNNVINKE